MHKLSVFMMGITDIMTFLLLLLSGSTTLAHIFNSDFANYSVVGWIWYSLSKLWRTWHQLYFFTALSMAHTWRKIRSGSLETEYTQAKENDRMNEKEMREREYTERAEAALWSLLGLTPPHCRHFNNCSLCYNNTGLPYHGRFQFLH